MESGEKIGVEEVEVMAKPERRRFTAGYKLRILREADACEERGALGALLRREGVYSSRLVAWREARRRGELAGLAPRKRGPKAKPIDPRDKKLADLTRQNQRLLARLDRAEKIIELQKKVSEILGVALPKIDETP